GFLRSSLVSKHAFVRAWLPGRNRRLQAVNPTPANAERVALHFPWPRVRSVSATTARNAISKMKKAEYFHSGFATPLRSNPRAGNHRRRDTGGCKSIRQAQTAVASRRTSPRDA